MKNMEKENFKESPEKQCFWVVVKKKGLFVKMAFLEKLANTICVRKVKKRAFSLQLSVFGKWSFFVPIQSHQTLQK